VNAGAVVKKRNINKKLYPTKWNEFSNSFDENEAIEQYYKFCRSFCLEKYQLKFGTEEGERLFYEKKNSIRRGMSLENCVARHGKEKGQHAYDEWKKGVKNTRQNFIRRHGQKKGVAMWESYEMNRDKLLVSYNEDRPNDQFNTKIEYWLKATGGDQALAEVLLSKRQATSTLEKLIQIYGISEGPKKYKECSAKKATRLIDFIEKYGESEGVQRYEERNAKVVYSNSLSGMIAHHGEIEGKRKYQDACRKKAHTLENFIKRHGEISGKEKWDKYLAKKSFAGTLLGYIDRYGPVLGKTKFDERIKNWQGDFTQINYSKISFEFFTEVEKKLKEQNCNVTMLFGESEKRFYVKTHDRKVIQPDCLIENIKLAIEFYGDYWHKNPKIYEGKAAVERNEEDIRRALILKEQHSIDTIVVWENDYKTNKEESINRISDIIIKRISNGDN